MRSGRCLLTLALVSLLALPAFAQLPQESALLNPGSLTPGSCGATAALAQGEKATAAPLFFYTVPRSELTEARNQVTVQAFVDGELFLEERFRLDQAVLEHGDERALEALRSSHPEGPQALTGKSLEQPRTAVFELLSDRPAVRAHFHQLAASGEHQVRLDVLVNDRSVRYFGFDELLRSGSDELAEAGLPTLTNATAQVFSTAADKPDAPQEFYVCGDGSCGGGTPPVGENCESCPQDCGGPCSICGNGFCGGTETCSTCAADCGACPSCPTDLGTESRTDYLGSTSYYTYCMDGWPGTAYYTYQKNDYKHYDVQLTEECDGSITETVVPGSTTYSSSYCWRYVGGYCTFTYGYASPICF
ncbi:MAG: heterocycloanthracin/sonorensin family bacteriocin [Acidobacteriota bacterium]|nr:heterocycloanthracin/sonorensin family bacteriocin [Acidobacteriota bacterium]